MSAKRYNENQHNDNSYHHNDKDSKSTLNCKLERRRRIEDLHEDRRLKHELNEYL